MLVLKLNTNLFTLKIWKANKKQNIDMSKVTT